ncbi:MAG: ParB/RepB/Spo0J family partition protein [Nitrospirae bacterium]|nr:ParB/RepB/Spo0J family partition protein [Nitrospirota bacterium]MBI3594281.1 ParB/RepB/Spo0J family partition protein [Nitrospirota bacterium]
MDRQKLGKGLSVLIRQNTLENEERNRDFIELDLSRIVPNKYQPRIEFDSSELEELAASIQVNGVIQPVMVRSKGLNQYELVAGERRFRASQMAGLKKIPAYIRNISDREMLEFALIENIQRADLNPLEEARAYERLIKEFGLTQEGIAKQVGKERSSIANSLRLLELPKEIRDLISDGKLSVGHAKILMTIQMRDHQMELVHQILEKGISVRQADLLAKKIAQPRHTRNKRKEAVWVDLEDRLKRSLGTKVSIETGRKGGKIMIEYYGPEDLERLMEIMLGWNQQG